MCTRFSSCRFITTGSDNDRYARIQLSPGLDALLGAPHVQLHVLGLVQTRQIVIFVSNRCDILP